MSHIHINFEHVNYSYEKSVPILQDITFTAHENDSIGLIGANGVGKSTLLRLLVGLNLDYEGSIRVEEMPVVKEMLPKVREKIGYVFQDSDSQLFMSTVFEDVAFAPRNYGLLETEVEQRVSHALEQIHMYIKGGMLKETSLEKVEELQPLLMERADKKFLMKRVTEQDSENYKNRILIIGCGSVGGHVICELAKAGYEDLTIVDYEKLTEENIFRHVLGMEYVNRYKCEALNTYIQKNIPEVKITTLAERIEDAIIEEDIVFEDYNLIISATGNHNLNRWVNSWILDNKIEVPVVYLWNEVYGIGNHVAYIKYGNCGCYECFFDRDEETGELYDKTSYCKRGQIITESAGGCGKTYVPYGNLVSLKTMLLCLKMVKDIFEEKLDDNLLISLKGDNDYLEKHNLEISGRYLRQQERIKILTGKQFVNINCGVCNDCNGK